MPITVRIIVALDASNYNQQQIFIPRIQIQGSRGRLENLFNEIDKLFKSKFFCDLLNLFKSD